MWGRWLRSLSSEDLSLARVSVRVAPDETALPIGCLFDTLKEHLFSLTRSHMTRDGSGSPYDEWWVALSPYTLKDDQSACEWVEWSAKHSKTRILGALEKYGVESAVNEEGLVVDLEYELSPSKCNAGTQTDSSHDCERLVHVKMARLATEADNSHISKRTCNAAADLKSRYLLARALLYG